MENQESANGSFKQVKQFANDKIVTPVRNAAEKLGTSVKESSNAAVGTIADNMEHIGKQIKDSAEGMKTFPETTKVVGERVQHTAQHLREKGVDGMMEDLRSSISARPLTAVACVAAFFVFGPRLFRR